MSSLALATERQKLGDLGDRVFRGALIVGVVGVAASILLGLLADDHDRFFRSWLVAFMFCTSISLGGLFFVFIQHLTRAGWSVSVRRIAEGITANLGWIWILFIPIVLSLWMSHQYHWVHPEGDDLLEHKAPFLNVPFWIARSVIFLAIWAVLGLFYFRNSVAQDSDGGVHLTHRMQRFAPITAVLFALTLTYSAVDWVMSLEAHWFSTMFGVYFFAASCCGFFSALILAIYALQRKGLLENEITLEHYQDLGKHLFAFGVVFWAYIAFSQYMLIWYGNIPEETTWYMARQLGGWRGVSMLLLVGHFVLPFLLLVTKHTKRVKPVIAVIAGWMLFMHYVDVYWNVMPKIPAALTETTSYAALQTMVNTGEVDVGWAPHLLDLTCLIGVAGLFVAGTVHSLRKCALIPLGDPRLNQALVFENV